MENYFPRNEYEIPFLLPSLFKLRDFLPGHLVSLLALGQNARSLADRRSSCTHVPVGCCPEACWGCSSVSQPFSRGQAALGRGVFAARFSVVSHPQTSEVFPLPDSWMG